MPILIGDTTINSTSATLAGNLLVDTNTLFVDNTNDRVGIGTTNPSTKLHLYESGASDAIFRITPENGTYDSIIQLTGQGNNLAQEGFEIWYDNDVGDVHLGTTFPSDAASIHFHTRTGASKSTSNERLTILGNGNVGIGTTTPAAKLHVEDGSMLLGDISGGSTSTPSGYRLQFDNSYATGSTSTSYAPKIVMHEASTWLGGFGISDSHVDYFSGAAHRWFTGTNPSTPTRGTERLKIHAAGYITMSGQPIFAAKHNGYETPSAGTPLTSWTVTVNDGGGSWNSGTGTYTVPIGGRYLVTCSLLRDTGGAAGGVNLQVNGSNVLRMFYVDAGEGYEMGSGQFIVSVSTNDTIRVVNENTVTWYGDNAGLGNFTINLLG